MRDPTKYTNPSDKWSARIVDIIRRLDILERLYNRLAGTPWMDIGTNGSSFMNGWSNYDAVGSYPGYRKCQFRKVGDEVQLRGICKGGTAAVDMIQLPASYACPSSNDHIPVVANAGFGFVRVGSGARITADPTAGTVWVDLGPVRYSTTPRT